MFDLSAVSKAVAGGLVGAIVAVVFRYTGAHVSPDAVQALDVLATAIVGYVVGHIAVWLAPANRPKL